jgi:AraC-like DNA-binding protein
MDQQAVAFARSWATRYVRTKHPYGLDVEDVENRILESLYKYSRGKMNGRDSARPSQDGEATEPQCMMKALSGALNEIQNESRRNLRALCPWQVRNAEPHLETQAYRNLACDMHSIRIRQSVRENDRRKVRLVLAMMSPEDRLVAHDFMELLSWKKVAARRGMSESTFRRHVLDGFIARFKEAWRKIS